MTDLYREVLENIMMMIQAFTPEQKEYYQNLGTRIYELKRLIKANGPKREPIEIETIEKYIKMMESCLKKGKIA